MRIRLTMVAVNRRYHVALVDRLPAGLEIISPDLAVAESVPADPSDASNRSWWWWYTWYNHQNLRDAGAEPSPPTCGTASMTTPTWRVRRRPARMSSRRLPRRCTRPVFGRSGSETVIVE